MGFLDHLKKMGVFLVDIYDKPLKVRGSDEGEQKIIEAIPNLYDGDDSNCADSQAFSLKVNSFACRG